MYHETRGSGLPAIQTGKKHNQHSFAHSQTLGNGRHSLQLFVVVIDKCIGWELLMLPSNAFDAPHLTPFREPDGDTSKALQGGWGGWPTGNGKKF